MTQEWGSGVGKRWPACTPRVLVVHEEHADADWIDRVEGLCACQEITGRSDPSVIDAAMTSSEVDLVLLHGQQTWVESRIRHAASDNLQSALLVVLRPWSSSAAADILRQAADDVVGPSIDGQELCARIHAILRRLRAANPGSGSVPVRMRRAERKLLEYLRACPGRVVTQNEILDNVFGGLRASGTSLVRVHVSRLRRRLGATAALRTVRGAGYVLDVGERGER